MTNSRVKEVFDREVKQT